MLTKVCDAVPPERASCVSVCIGSVPLPWHSGKMHAGRVPARGLNLSVLPVSPLILLPLNPVLFLPFLGFSLTRHLVSSSR